MAYSGWQLYSLSDGSDLTKPGDTIVVAAATGPVGATVGQLGKLNGCRVVGVAGGVEKCVHAKDTLGFDECPRSLYRNVGGTELWKACHVGEYSPINMLAKTYGVITTKLL